MPLVQRSRNLIRDTCEALGPLVLPERVRDLVLPYLDAELGKPPRFAVSIHGRVELPARIGLLVADVEAVSRQ